MKFNSIIDKFSKSPTEANMLQLISYFESPKNKIEEIAILAEVLANSGDRLKIGKNVLTADIPSTGGPSSLTTVLCPLYLADFGYTVPKLGVPGTPAGGVDILAQIPGYKIHFQKQEFELLLLKHKYIHALADRVFCPLDITLFKFRKKVGKVSVYPLVIASLLSKKIALGVKNVGLDIRVSPNSNFGKTFYEARHNADIFNQVAKLFGIASKCFLTDVRFPLQPYIGRGEALLALYEIFENNNCGILSKHLEICYSIAGLLINPKPNHSFTSINLKSAFSKNIIAQGSSYTNFLEKVNEIKSQSTVSIKSKSSGFLNIDLQSIKMSIAEGQKKLISSSLEFPDSCGCILLKDPGDFVKRNETLAILRINSNIKKRVLPLIQSCFSTQDFISKTPQYEEII